MAKTKAKIAQEMYGEELEYLSAGEKAAVTRAFNAQPKTRARARPAAPASATVKATIGRVAINGTKTCILPEGATVADLIEQSAFGFDEDKEGVIAQSTGVSVDLDDVVEHEEVYVITPEIKSA